MKLFWLFKFLPLDDTIQLCGVYGPGEVKLMKEIAERAYVSVVYKPRVGIPSKKINRVFELNYF